MNKTVLKFVTALLIIMTVISISISCLAASDLTPGNLTGDTSKVQNGVTSINNVGNSVIGVLQVVGIVLSVIVLIVLGIKYMMGSAEEKAEYKKTMMPYIVGAALIFAASAFAQVIYDFFVGVSGTV